MLLVISNSVGASEILRWNFSDRRFVSVWSGDPYILLEPMVIQQPGGTLYLLAGIDVITQNDGKIMQISRLSDQSDFVYR